MYDYRVFKYFIFIITTINCTVLIIIRIIHTSSRIMKQIENIEN